MSDTLKDYMAGWKTLGHTGKGLRKLLAKISVRRGLESYAVYSLDEAAARIDQLEATLSDAGIAIPDPSEPNKEERAYLLTQAMLEAKHEGHDICTIIWSQYGDEARDKAFARIKAEAGKEGA